MLEQRNRSLHSVSVRDVEDLGKQKVLRPSSVALPLVFDVALYVNNRLISHAVLKRQLANLHQVALITLVTLHISIYGLYMGCVQVYPADVNYVIKLNAGLIPFSDPAQLEQLNEIILTAKDLTSNENSTGNHNMNQLNKSNKPNNPIAVTLPCDGTLANIYSCYIYSMIQMITLY